MSRLFDSLTQRSLELRNRIGMSPMCMYSAEDGRPTPWHLVHLGARAIGGAGIVMTEAAAIEPRGRISLRDAGIWADEHVDAWRPIAAFLKEHGAVPAIQLAHAGRKAGTAPPDAGGRPLTAEDGGWDPIGPSPVAFAEGFRTPHEATERLLRALVDTWAAAAGRARDAGFEVLEIHAAHGYLLHSFLSPLANRRDDDHGGSLANRMRFPLAVVRAVRQAWPDELPLWMRISATDWADGGWDPDQSVALARELRSAGVDLVDCSSGGILPGIPIPAGPSYQVPLAETIRRGAGIETAAVGLITEPGEADEIVRDGRADVVLLGRQLLREPSWPVRAAATLGVEPDWPVQYTRAAGPPAAIPR